MSPVTHRGRRRLDRDLPVERLRGLLDDDLRASGHDLPEGGAPPGVDDAAPGGPIAPPDPEEEQAWASPVRARIPWVTIVIAGLVLAAVVLSLVLRGEREPVIVGGDPAGAGAAASPEPGAAAGGAAEGTGSATPGPAEPAGAAEASAGPVTVHVVGEVRRPGVVEVPGGARVADAVEAAGGLSETAVVDAVNMAAPAADGAQIVIPDRALSESWEAAAPPGGPAASAGSTPGAAPAGAAPSAAPGSGPASEPDGAGESGAAIDLNQATAAQLEELPEVGPVLAQRIVDHREQIGGFRAVEELDDVSGIGPAMMAAIAPLVRV
ncbi:ComEA family DNA-binding protein [Kocuria palustris]|uniref:ComEA family DNA-binding protein n=1 Tax=Kocuria palustris TaxID=71999 RepID=UPI0011A3E737|nr:ComEA family DNA-binding protein [Kocuria palustris]